MRGDQSKTGWWLVRISGYGLIRATVEAFSRIPSVPEKPLARREKEVLAKAISRLEQQRVPKWMGRSTRESAKVLLGCNNGSIATTAVDFGIDDNVISISPRPRKLTTFELDGFERQKAINEEDLGWIETDSFETCVIGLLKHYEKPVVEVRERMGYTSAKCTLLVDLAVRIGREHNLAEIWNDQ